MRIKLNRRVHDTKEDKIIEAGEVIERSKERGKDFLAYGIEVKDPEEVKPKKKRSKK
jgi:hypothetical protein